MSTKKQTLYEGPELQWGIEDVKRLAEEHHDATVTDEFALDVLAEYFVDNETLMEYINDGLSFEIATRL